MQKVRVSRRRQIFNQRQPISGHFAQVGTNFRLCKHQSGVFGRDCARRLAPTRRRCLSIPFELIGTKFGSYLISPPSDESKNHVADQNCESENADGKDDDENRVEVARSSRVLRLFFGVFAAVAAAAAVVAAAAHVGWRPHCCLLDYCRRRHRCCRRCCHRCRRRRSLCRRRRCRSGRCCGRRRRWRRGQWPDISIISK